MSPEKIIRDKAFADRLAKAVEDNPYAPSGHGRQKWVRDNLREKFGVDVSAEALRKWFAGEARPRPSIMQLIAQLLEVDEAWLSLGYTPDETPQERKARNATADGAVNYVAGLIQMAGGAISFTEATNDKRIQGDIVAIVDGKVLNIEVKRANKEKYDEYTFRLSGGQDEIIRVGIIDTETPGIFQAFTIPSDIISSFGVNRGGYVEVKAARDGEVVTVNGAPLPRIVDFKKLGKFAADKSKKAG